MAGASRSKGRQSASRGGTSEPGGAVVPEPRVRRRGASSGDDGRDDDRAGEQDGTEPPAEVVHLIPAEHLDMVDTTGMSMPVGVGESVDAVRMPGDTVLTRPSESDVPSADELDRRDSAKGRRRKRTGPRPPAAARRETGAPAASAPPPTDPAPTDPAVPS